MVHLPVQPSGTGAGSLKRVCAGLPTRWQNPRRVNKTLRARHGRRNPHASASAQVIRASQRGSFHPQARKSGLTTTLHGVVRRLKASNPAGTCASAIRSVIAARWRYSSKVRSPAGWCPARPRTEATATQEATPRQSPWRQDRTGSACGQWRERGCQRGLPSCAYPRPKMPCGRRACTARRISGQTGCQGPDQSATSLDLSRFGAAPLVA